MSSLLPRLHLWESIRSGLSEIMAHKLRSFLTLVGTILGTFSLVIMISIISGVRGMIAELFTDLGFDGIIEIVPKAPQNEADRLRFAMAPALTIEDAELLRRRVPGIVAVSGSAEFPVTVSIDGEKFNLRLRGTDPSYLAVKRREIQRGRNLTDLDLAQKARVALVTQDFVEEYIPRTDPLGREVLVNNVRLKIIGVIAKQDSEFFSANMIWRDAQVITIPVTTHNAFITGKDELSSLSLRIAETESLGTASAAVERVLEVAHRNIRNFEIEDIGAEIAQAEETAGEQIRTWNIILAALASVSLLVGGIGILSVMLIAIRERIYEIGLRKAIGATNIEVFIQFILESMVLSSVGAFIGIAAGVASVLVIAQFFPFALSPSPSGMALAFTFALAVGLVFGWYPAHKASVMEPVEALRG